MAHKRPRSYGSVHKGVKSKKVLEQEIWSLENRANSGMTEDESNDWANELAERVGEYAVRFGLDAIKEWKKWAKG